MPTLDGSTVVVADAAGVRGVRGAVKVGRVGDSEGGLIRGDPEGVEE